MPDERKPDQRDEVRARVAEMLERSKKLIACIRREQRLTCLSDAERRLRLR